MRDIFWFRPHDPNYTGASPVMMFDPGGLTTIGRVSVQTRTARAAEMFCRGYVYEAVPDGCRIVWVCEPIVRKKDTMAWTASAKAAFVPRDAIVIDD